MTIKVDLRNVSAAIATVLNNLGKPTLVAALADFICELVPLDDVLGLIYRRAGTPELVYAFDSSTTSRVNTNRYLEGAYLLDPFYSAAMSGVEAGCYRLQDLAPAAFKRSEYYRIYYTHSQVSDEIGYLYRATADVVLHLSLGRYGGSTRFSRSEVEVLQALSPLVIAIFEQQWGEQVPSARVGVDNRLQQGLDCFGSAFLTVRETEIVQMILRGHSTRSISERLGISPETVKLHRRNSYTKLDISSQAELFYLFIDSLGSVRDYLGGDPLTGYLTK